MSTDLYVYGPRVATPDEIARVVSDAGCLLVPDVDSWWCEVPGPVDPLHCFEISAGDTEASEDVAPVVMHVLHALGADVSEPGVHMLTLRVAFSDSLDLMVQVSAGIAKRIGGLVCDPSDNTIIFPDGFANVDVPVAAAVRVDTVDVTWYGSPTAERPGWARRIMEVAQTTFPEAVPVRWEQWGRAKRTKPRAFRWADIDEFERASTVDMVLWNASPPFFRGNMSRVTNAEGGNRAPYPSPFSDVGMSLNAAALEDPHRHRQLLDLVTGIADELDAVYAHGQLARNMLYREGEIFSSAGSMPSGFIFASSIDGCIGLPPRGVWLEWFGQPYLPYVSHMLGRIARPAGSGLLAEYGRDEALRASVLSADLVQGPGNRPAAVIPRL